MADFDPAVELVLKHEGSEYTDHPLDSGGPTKFGITLQTLVLARGLGASKEDIKNLTKEEAKEIYRRLYWSPNRFGFISVQKVSDVLFDQAVLLGGPSASKRAQIALKRLGKNLNVTGKWDTNTISTINSTDPVEFGVEFLIECQEFLTELVTSKPSQLIFMKGWLFRTHSLLRHLVELN